MEVIMNYIKPELIVVAIVLYLVGLALKKTERITDKYIPFILGILGIAIALIYVFAVSLPFDSAGAVLMAIFTAIVQGILCAGLSTYANQMIKQLNKEE